ncbi:hypothetical protein TWF506_005893 [Arthrobotrys conoides]|uniref:MARVEL domain-containing protein n=1 Tax=Arthrobotrys conoides TaxID=74498 RepID=A0AAN8NK30_9PEZI
MAGSVWPFIPFMALRGAQVFFAIIVLGLSGYVGDQLGNYWSPWFCLVTAIFTLIGSGGLIAAYFLAPAFTAPLITLGIDGFLWLFWLISLAGFADQASPVLNIGSCDYLINSNICGSIKGNMAMVVFEFLLFLGTLGFSGWLFYRERTGKGGAAGANPEGGHASAGAIAGAPPVAATHGTYPMQQQQPPAFNQGPVDNAPTPVPFPQEGQYQYPPQSPPPQQYTQSPPPQGYTQSPPPQQYPEMPVPAGTQGYQQQPYQQQQ